MYCSMCEIFVTGQAPWLEHLAGRKHRHNAYMKQVGREARVYELIYGDDVKVKEEQEEKLPSLEVSGIQFVSFKKPAQRPWHLIAATVLIVAILLSYLIVGVKADAGNDDTSMFESWVWWPFLLFLGWQLGKFVSWCKETLESFIQKFDQRVTSIERNIANVGVNIEQQVQQAGIHLQLSMEQKVTEIEQKVSTMASPMVESVKTGFDLASVVAICGAVYYLCRALFVRHHEKKESLEKLTQSKVFKLFDFLAMAFIIPMMLSNGLKFAYDMWKQVKFVSSLAYTACSGVSILGSLFGGGETVPAIDLDHVKFVQSSVEKLSQSVESKLEERKQATGDEDQKLNDSDEMTLEMPDAKRVKWMDKVQKEMAARFPNDPRYAALVTSSSVSAPRLPGDTRGLGAPAASENPKPDVPSNAFDALRDIWSQTEDLIHLNTMKEQVKQRPWLLPVSMIILFSVLLLVVKVLHKSERKSRKKEKSKAKTEKVEAKTQQPKKNASKKKKEKSSNKSEAQESHSGCCHVTVGKHICPWFKAGHKIGVDANKHCHINCGGLKCFHWRDCDPPGYPALTPIPESKECVHTQDQVKCLKCGWTYEGAKSKQRRNNARKNKAARNPAHLSYGKPGETDQTIWSRDVAGNLVKTKRDDINSFVVPSHLPHAGLLNDFMHGTNEAAQRGAAKKLVAAVSKTKKGLDGKHISGKCSICGAIGHTGKSCPNKRSHPCYFFTTKGNCKFGDKCEFLHPAKDQKESAVNGKRFSLGKVQSAVGLARIDNRALNAVLMWNGIIVCAHIFKFTYEEIKFQFRQGGELFEHTAKRDVGKKIGHDLLWFPKPSTFDKLPTLHHSLPSPGQKVALFAYDSDEQFLNNDISFDAGRILRLEDAADSIGIAGVSKHKVGIYKLSSIDGNCTGVVVNAENGKVVGFHNATRGGIENVFLAITPEIVSAVTGAPRLN